ncbi:MAG: PA0069 family radical SAM protein [Shimia sp.]
MTRLTADTARPAGRSTAQNPAGRFEATTRAWADDGWGGAPDADPVRTEVRHERPRKVITRNTSPDISFDRSVNPYRGCEHGCIYCFARPGHAYLGLSPGLDFESVLTVKPDAPRRLETELRSPRYAVAPITIGTNTDPYQPLEAEHRIMRGCLEVLRDHRHPVMVTTKGSLVERDFDILAEMAADGLARLAVSVTTLDAGLARRMEPRVPSPARRLAVIAAAAEAGIPVRVLVSPVVPGLTDHEIEAILGEAAARGAEGASWAMLRLPHEVAGLWDDWLDREEPGRAAKVRARVRECHGGKAYDAKWFKRLRGEGLYAQMIAQRFRVAARRAGLDGPMPELRCDLFRIPPRPGDQLSLL